MSSILDPLGILSTDPSGAPTLAGFIPDPLAAVSDDIKAVQTTLTNPWVLLAAAAVGTLVVLSLVRSLSGAAAGAARLAVLA